MNPLTTWTWSRLKLNNALYKFDGTVIFVSHDREFVSSLATQIIEIKDKKLNHFDGNY